MPHALLNNILRLIYPRINDPKALTSMLSTNVISGEVGVHGAVNLNEIVQLEMLRIFLAMIQEANEEIRKRNELIKKMIDDKNIQFEPEPFIDINEYFYNGHTIFLFAVANGVGLDFIRMLQAFPGIDIKRCRKDTRKDVAYYAAKGGSIEVLDYLYQQNFDMFAHDKAPPLIAAIKAQQTQCIEFLTRKLLSFLVSDELLFNYLEQRMLPNLLLSLPEDSVKRLIEDRKKQILQLLQDAFEIAYMLNCNQYCFLLMQAKIPITSPLCLVKAAENLDVTTVNYLCDMGTNINNTQGVCVALSCAYHRMTGQNYLQVIFSLLVRGAGIAKSLRKLVYDQIATHYFVRSLKMADLMICIFDAIIHRNRNGLESILCKDEYDTEEILCYLLFSQDKWPSIRVSLSAEQRDFLLSSPIVQSIDYFPIGKMCLSYLFERAKESKKFGAVKCYADELKKKRGFKKDEHDACAGEVYEAFFNNPSDADEKKVWSWSLVSFLKPRKKEAKEFEMKELIEAVDSDKVNDGDKNKDKEKEKEGDKDEVKERLIGLMTF